MPSEWSQRLRQLSDMPRNRETLSRLTEVAPIPERFRSRSAPASASISTTNPFTEPPIPTANPFTRPPAPGPNPFLPTTYGEGAGAHTTPSVNTSPAAPPARPAAVRVAFFALLSAAASTLALAGLGVYAIAELRYTFDNVLKIDKSGTAAVIASGYADNTEIALLVAAAALGAVLTVCYLFVARAIWKGRSWPRRVNPVLAFLSLPALFIGHIALIAVLAGVIAAAACWVPSARTFATQSRAYTLAQRAARRAPTSA
ncbi:hypothetical protein ACGFK1_04750 [Mycobacterium sp. NPDC048908]|uniref:hypothetical protein n=1 Tax=Mycobacterium sp. NPDC048908 TaxID=3364292 RepID=UPI003715E65F